MTALSLTSTGAAALSDPTGSSSLSTGALWVPQTLLGNVATSVAVIAVASIGFLMITGRVQLRRGATVIIGCFILFGAPTIAAGLLGLSQASVGGQPEAGPIASSVPPPAPVPTPQPGIYDPYAGAAVPQR